jgi:hypothetical protein
MKATVSAPAKLVSPQIKIPGDEFRALIDADVLRIPDHPANLLQRLHDILAAIAEARIDRWREAAEGVDDRKHADLPARSELVVNEVHHPSLVDLTCISAVLAQLGLDATLRRFVAQLQA